ncbi:MAG: MOSC domain-containing protein [Acidimicrobiales bacterium]
MIAIGPYRFTEHDARKTLQAAPVVLAMMAAGRDPDPIAVLADRVAALLDAVDPMRLAPEDLPWLLEAVWSTVAAAPGMLRAGGHLPPTQIGSVVQVNTSPGGVPKGPVAEARVAWRGITGDVQKERTHHGRPFQALCLWSAEVIDRLRADGHPIGYGSAGENITIGGLDWDAVRPGVQLQLGTVTCEVWAYAVPCKKNARWLLDGDFGRLHHDRAAAFGGAVSRVYARVTEPGVVCPGDPAVLEP